MLAWMAALEARAAGADLDPARVLVLALVHDLPEAEIGDWTPYTAAEVASHDATGERGRHSANVRQDRSPERTSAKRAAEQVVIDQLVAVLPPAAGRTLESLWQELAAGTSPEARFVKQVDQPGDFPTVAHLPGGRSISPHGVIQRRGERGDHRPRARLCA